MAQGGRVLRVGQEIQRMLAPLLRTEVKDPRIRALVTITAVDVSPDLRQAKVFVTLLGGDGAIEGTIDALNRCAPFLRTLLSGRMRLRSVPALSFVFDASVGRGARLTRLIDSAMHEAPEDADHEAQRKP